MQTMDFDLDSGALSLDFANTAEWHASAQPQELLHSYGDLITWGETAEIIAPDRAGQLREMAEAQPVKAQMAFDRALALRETIYRLFAGYSEEGVIDQGDLAALNTALSEAMAHLEVVPAAEGFDWGWMENGEGFDEILWPVARSAGELLTTQKLARVRQCADDRGCGYLFVDTSRNRSRRWCSMESCGNRAKAQRHYRRHKSEDKPIE